MFRNQFLGPYEIGWFHAGVRYECYATALKRKARLGAGLPHVNVRWKMIARIDLDFIAVLTHDRRHRNTLS